MFGKLGDIASLMKQAPEIMRQAQEMQSKAAEVQEQLKEARVEGVAGGGMVNVSADGQQRVLNVKIDPTLLETPDAEMLEDLILAATNQALEKSREKAAEMMQGLTSNMDIPGMQDMMGKFGLGPTATPPSTTDNEDE